MITAIMIDSREPAWVQHLKFGGIPNAVNTLDFGDVLAVADDGHTLIFERKTPSDFLNTLKDDRLFPQLARMTEMKNAEINSGEPITHWPYLIITGSFLPGANGKVVADGRETGWGYASVMGTLLSIQELGVFVVFCNGDMDFEDCILRIGKRDRDPEMKILAPRPAKMLGPKFNFLTGIPDVGIETAQKILECSGDNVAHALIGITDMDIKMPVPVNVRKRFRDMLGLCEGENLEIIGTQIMEPITEGE